MSVITCEDICRLQGHAGKIREMIELPGKYRKSLNGTVTISGEASFSFTLHDGYSRLIFCCAIEDVKANPSKI